MRKNVMLFCYNLKSDFQWVLLCAAGQNGTLNVRNVKFYIRILWINEVNLEQIKQ